MHTLFVLQYRTKTDYDMGIQLYSISIQFHSLRQTNPRRNSNVRYAIQWKRVQHIFAHFTSNCPLCSWWLRTNPHPYTRLWNEDHHSKRAPFASYQSRRDTIPRSCLLVAFLDGRSPYTVHWSCYTYESLLSHESDAKINSSVSSVCHCTLLEIKPIQ